MSSTSSGVFQVAPITDGAVALRYITQQIEPARFGVFLHAAVSVEGMPSPCAGDAGANR